MGEITVADAAVRLGVSPSRVRALAGAGSLPGRKVGGLWLLEEDAVDAAGRDPRRSGRPLSPRMAWGLIALAEGDDPVGLSAPERSRLRGRLREGPSLDDVAPLARNRADVGFVHIHPGALSRALAWPSAVRSGISADHDLTEVGVVELYVPSGTADRIVRDLRGRPCPRGDANLVLHTPRGDHWPFDGCDQAGPVTVAFDLWDARDSRSRRTARRLWDGVVGRFERNAR